MDGWIARGRGREKKEFKGGVVSIGHGMDIILSLKYRRRSKEENKKGEARKRKRRKEKEKKGNLGRKLSLRIPRSMLGVGIIVRIRL